MHENFYGEVTRTSKTSFSKVKNFYSRMKCSSILRNDISRVWLNTKSISYVQRRTLEIILRTRI